MKKLIAVILALVFVLSLSACGAEEPASDLDYVKENGKLVVGITDFAPMDYEDENGEWIGFDADMAKEFAEYLGVEVEFIVIDWDNKIFELENKSIDVVWNGMTLTDKVKDAMGTSDPYCKNAQVVVVKADVADQYQDEASLADLAFAVEAGSAGKETVEGLGLNFTEVAYQSDALMEVAAGTSDACVIDLLMAGAMIGEGTGYPDLAYTVSLTSEEYVVGFRKGSELVDEFNKFWADACAEGTVLETAKVYGVQESVIIK
ncbi:MAG: transporter substrate-binding domain-containing protein [Oscillospiraceae bacterium]|nr:transporter substrate-binding domain-containing protein [Oscillospiraceae bacterium]